MVYTVASAFPCSKYVYCSSNTRLLPVDRQALKTTQKILTSLSIFVMKVLCASNEDHSQCEPLVPPAGAEVGSKVTFPG